MKLHKLIAFAGLALILSAAPGCSDDSTLTPLPKPEMTLGNATYSSLSFNWSKVNGARQYYYELTKSGSDDIIQSGLTKDHTITFASLEPSTEYTLTLLAYAAIDSDNTTSEPIVLTGRTNDLIAIASPTPTWSRELNSLIFEWDAVTNARDYAYSFTDAEGNEIASGTTFNTSVAIESLQTSRYTFSVIAQTIEDGMRDSDPGTISIDFVREHEEIWRVTTAYSSSLLGESWNATLVAYDDNAYTILDWYGVEGYDFSFKIDESDAADMFKVDKDVYPYDAATGSYAVPTGIESMPTVYVTASANQSAFEGSTAKGNVSIKVSDGTTSGYDNLGWGITLQDLVGSWTLSWEFYDSEDSAYDDIGERAEEIVLGDEPNTLLVTLPSYYGFTLGQVTLVVDMETLTFTLAPVPFGYDKWIMGGGESETTPITGTITEKQIKFGEFQMWYLYGGAYYGYVTNKSTITYTRE